MVSLLKLEFAPQKVILTTRESVSLILLHLTPSSCGYLATQACDTPAWGRVINPGLIWWRVV